MNWSCKPRKRELGRLDREGGKKGGGGKEERVRYTHTHTHTHRELEEDEGTSWMLDERFGSRRSSCAGRMTCV